MQSSSRPLAGAFIASTALALSFCAPAGAITSVQDKPASWPAITHVQSPKLPPPIASANSRAGTPRSDADHTRGEARAQKKSACGTKFGPELPTPDGIIAWNDGSSTDTAGAADVVCSADTTIDSLEAYGYFGDTTDRFHVTFYGDSTASGSSQPDDSNVLCDYPSVTGPAGGQYPTHALTHLDLAPACTLTKGVSWVSIQNVNPSNPWYWEAQNSKGGNAGPDWVDRTDAFGSGCTTFNNGRNLNDCLGYPYPDFMVNLLGSVKEIRNLTTKGANLGAGNQACPDQPYYLYSGGKSDNFTSPADLSYPRPDLLTFMGSSYQGNVNYDVPMNNGRFGDSFNLQNTRSVCYAVIQFRAKETGDIAGNDGLTFGHIGAGGAPFNVVGQVIDPGGTTAIQSYALNATGLNLLSMQTGYLLNKTTDQSIFDLYLQDDTEIDFFKMYVWYGPNCAQGGPYGGC